MSNSIDTSRAKVLETILVLVLACGVFYWLSKNNYLLLAAAVFGAAGLFIPALAKGIHWVWMKIAQGMGYVMSKVILSIVFFVFMIPLAAISRLFTKNKTVQMKAGATSYFKERNFTYNKESLENVW